MDQIEIGKFIAKCRKNKKLTQAQLAEKLNITDRAISKWETGKGMPDSSIMIDLCNELGITADELLNGGKTEKENEKSIINNLETSNKKLKKKRTLLKIILVIILIFTVTMFILFAIDIYRMKNNEPVFFSTWGLSYEPPLDINYEKVEKIIKEDLSEKHENSYLGKGKVFVSLKTFLIKQEKNKIYLYSWVVEKEYYKENEILIEGGASSIPYKIELIKVNDNYVVSNYELPRDGIYYRKRYETNFSRECTKRNE